MKLSKVLSESDKSLIKYYFELMDVRSIRKILHRWGVTQCEVCDYTDQEVLDWISWGIKNEEI